MQTFPYTTKQKLDGAVQQRCGIVILACLANFVPVYHTGSRQIDRHTEREIVIEREREIVVHHRHHVPRSGDVRQTAQVKILFFPAKTFYRQQSKVRVLFGENLQKQLLCAHEHLKAYTY